MSTRPADAITDFAQFQGLRAGARKGDAAAVTKAAQQFEALLTQQLFKSMRAGSLGDDVMGGGQTGFYQDLFDQQMAVHLSSGKGLGLADMLVRQLRGAAASAVPVPDAGAKDSASGAMPLAQRTKLYALAQTASALSPMAAPPLADDAAGGVASPRSWLDDIRVDAAAETDDGSGTDGSQAVADAASPADAGSPQAFVQAILPHAERAARALGVPARVLVAQAALETGWGRHAIRAADGKASFNFFGIKSDARWQGDEVRTTTTEYVQGGEQRQRADFRAYESAGQAFDDYVDFLRSNPRYAAALRHGGSAARFVQGLQQAGYATDPAYAQKILKIAGGRTMQLAFAGSGRLYAV